MFLKKYLEPVRKPTLDLPLEKRKKMWFWPFIRSYVVVFICYMMMYVIRKNLNIAENNLISDYGLSITQIGVIGFGFSIAYGIGKTAMNYFTSNFNSKNVLPLSLLLSALCVLGFGFSMGASNGAFYLMIGFYALSGWFQSTGGSNSYATITKWTSRKNRGTFLGIWNISHNVGGASAAFIAIFGANVIFHGNVVGMFIFPATIAIIISIIGLFMGNDSPESYGLGSAEELFNEEKSKLDLALDAEKMSKGQIFMRFVLFNKIIWLLCIANIFLYIIRIGIDQWSPIYAHEVLGFNNDQAVSGFALFETGALVGTCLWGWLSDLANGRRALVSCISLVLIIFCLGFYQHAHSLLMLRTSLFCLGFLVFGPQLLIAVSAVGFVPKKAVAVTDGLKGTFAYLIGDSFAKLGLGLIADHHNFLGMSGWKGTFSALDLSAVLCIIILIFVVIAEEKMIRKDKKLNQ